MCSAQNFGEMFTDILVPSATSISLIHAFGVHVYFNFPTTLCDAVENCFHKS